MSGNRTSLSRGWESIDSRSDRADHLSIVHRKSEDCHACPPGERPAMFCGISPEDYARIYAAARSKTFSRGDMLYREGDPVQQVLLLTSGVVKVTQLGTKGTEVILRLAVPGDIIGALGLLSTGKHGTTAQAAKAGRALIWDAPTFRSLMERFPVMRHNLVRVLSQDLLELEERFREVATERVGPRLARQLVRLRHAIGREVDGAVEISLSREDLAGMTGTTLFTVSRLLSAWALRGMVKPGREAVTICDVKSLAALSEES